MSKERTTNKIDQFRISAAGDRQSRDDPELNETVDDYYSFWDDAASEMDPIDRRLMEMRSALHYRRISGRRKGLCSDRDPFGDELVSTKELLLYRIAELNVTGNVEFYLSSDCGSMDSFDCKIALGFSHINTAADLRQIKQTFESYSKSRIWSQHMRDLKETHHEDDRCFVEQAEALEEEQGVDNLVEDQWRIETLSAIRRKSKYLGALEYKNGSLVTILDDCHGIIDLVGDHIRL